jgi:hypothetical protein
LQWTNGGGEEEEKQNRQATLHSMNTVVKTIHSYYYSQE